MYWCPGADHADRLDLKTLKDRFGLKTLTDRLDLKTLAGRLGGLSKF